MDFDEFELFFSRLRYQYFLFLLFFHVFVSSESLLFFELAVYVYDDFDKDEG